MKSFIRNICLVLSMSLLLCIQIKEQVKDKSSSNLQNKSKSKYLQCPCADLAPPCCSPEFQTVSHFYLINKVYMRML